MDHTVIINGPHCNHQWTTLLPSMDRKFSIEKYTYTWNNIYFVKLYYLVAELEGKKKSWNQNKTVWIQVLRFCFKDSLRVKKTCNIIYRWGQFRRASWALFIFKATTFRINDFSNLKIEAESLYLICWREYKNYTWNSVLIAHRLILNRILAFNMSGQSPNTWDITRPFRLSKLPILTEIKSSSPASFLRRALAVRRP